MPGSSPGMTTSVCSNCYIRPWQCLNFWPEPHGQGALRGTLPQVDGSAGSTPCSGSGALALHAAIVGAVRHRHLGHRRVASATGRAAALVRRPLHRGSRDAQSTWVTVSRRLVSIASNSSKASRLYSLSGSRWP